MKREKRKMKMICLKNEKEKEKYLHAVELRRLAPELRLPFLYLSHSYTALSHSYTPTLSYIDSHSYRLNIHSHSCMRSHWYVHPTPACIPTPTCIPTPILYYSHLHLPCLRPGIQGDFLSRAGKVLVS
jgi:hypothetical protein